MMISFRPLSALLLLLCPLLLLPGATAAPGPFVHPGMLHTEADFTRIRARLASQAQPWSAGWQVLTANPHAAASWTPRPVPVVYRGKDREGHAENYSLLFNDAAAAYALALRWKISGETVYAERAVAILDGWASTLAAIEGSSDRFLAAGIYGYQLANAGELLRTYPGWQRRDFSAFQAMMLRVFYPMNHDFLVHHNGARIDHYWANWDLANMSSMIAIGILTDRHDLYDEAVDYFHHGAGNGALAHLVWTLYPDGLGQVQESGRDQGHTMLDLALVGAFCQMAWSQGDDLFGADHNRLLRGVEYVARYNLGEDVPYTPYRNSDVNQSVIAEQGRGQQRPIWALLYQHYGVLKGLPAPYTARYAQQVQPEGGGGNYGPNSGGYDQLGYGTLMYTLR